MADRRHLDALAEPGTRVLAITRLFEAPRERVFEAFIDPDHAMHWLGPRGYTMTHLQADLRPGGAWRGCMRVDADGRELWHGGVYREIVRPERIAFTFAWDDPRIAPETLVTITFEDQGRKTLMRFTQGLFDSAQTRESHRTGWEHEFDQLANYVWRRRADG